ncbi:magnesium/cobalt transporter CorA [Alkaliflexus imshenetskii]|uniref:magnesium/cobalt transporter CorA n=1 Tax=Alkaliflexus imshenetskii TaxID=286730 RepID=UPI0004BB6209|nr:magnesium/cobalt transporter CorA [Alkaliflexus imshenetskii]
MNIKVRKSVVRFKGLFGASTARRVSRKPPGEAPGTIVHTGIQKLDQVLITLHTFNESTYTTSTISSIKETNLIIDDDSKVWIQVRGLHDIATLKDVWSHFDLHPLIQEDIVSINQRPKVEPYDNVIFMVLRMISGNNNGKTDEFTTEQISLVVGSNYVLSFQESDTSVFEPVIRRLAMPNTRLRKLGADYMAYALIDNIVDHYFSALDLMEATIEDTEERIVNNPKSVHLQNIHTLRRDLIFFRKSVWSLRDGINSLIRDDSSLFTKEVRLFLRDVYDHVNQVVDTIENQREMVYSLYDMYMSSLSNRMNEVMKVLTIISTIFIPLTFVAGIYGMNFNPESSAWNMPELDWRWGYPASLGLMAIIVAVMLIYFKRKEWI